MFGGVYRHKRVWVSGTTGFKGAWLAEWLHMLGARVTGFALPPETDPSLFDQLGLGDEIEQEYGDLRDAELVRRSLERAQPDFVFHLAAQAIVRVGYQKPIETYAANVMGTVHVLDALRSLTKPCAAVFVTSDKCYENREWHYGYREDDPLGGHDPYSSSKGAAEIAISSWRRSFFEHHSVKIASARAGNVIGGGDWAANRIVPDCVRALQKGERIVVRNPTATRPWQHVLEPLSGYLWLAACLASDDAYDSPRRPSTALDSAFNFGPPRSSSCTVSSLVEEILKHWPGNWEDRADCRAPHEARLLHLCTDKASAVLGWEPVWGLADSVRKTVEWYRQAAALPCDPAASASLRSLTRQQIEEFQTDAARYGLRWACP